MTKVKIPSANNQGIRGILLEIQKAKKRAQKKAKIDGKEIFRLVTQDKSTPGLLNSLVYQESLRELIFFTLDHRKDVTTSVNRLKSIAVRAKKAEKDRDLVFDWCNKNPGMALKPLRLSLEKAAAATGIRQQTTVRKYILLWRKDNKKK